MKHVLPNEIDVYVISLRTSTDRRAKVEEILGKTSLNWQFFDAINKHDLTYGIPQYIPKKVKRLLGFELTPNELGCFLSHRACWGKAACSNKTTLIFEDDFLLNPSFNAALNFALSRGEDWDICRLQGLFSSKDQVLEGEEEIRLVKTLNDPVGATAYIVSPHGAKILVHNSIEIYEPADHYLEHVSKHGLRVLAIKPYPVETTKATSTITDRPPRPPIKGFRKRLRSLFRGLDRLMSKNPWF
jgi:glycosyl transferase, family 25